MKRNTEDNRFSLGFAETLTLLFIALKLCGVIDWSWLWILSPIWISFSIVALIAIAVVLIDESHR